MPREGTRKGERGTVLHVRVFTRGVCSVPLPLRVMIVDHDHETSSERGVGVGVGEGGESDMKKESTHERRVCRGFVPPVRCGGVTHCIRR